MGGGFQMVQPGDISPDVMAGDCFTFQNATCNHFIHTVGVLFNEATHGVVSFADKSTVKQHSARFYKHTEIDRFNLGALRFKRLQHVFEAGFGPSVTKEVKPLSVGNCDPDSL